MNTQLSENTLKTVYSALLSELERRHEEMGTLESMARDYPDEDVWARFTRANESIITNLETAIQEVTTALFGETWGNLEVTK
jgi:hypothetical protein